MIVILVNAPHRGADLKIKLSHQGPVRIFSKLRVNYLNNLFYLQIGNQ